MPLAFGTFKRFPAAKSPFAIDPSKEKEPSEAAPQQTPSAAQSKTDELRTEDVQRLKTYLRTVQPWKKNYPS
jgi:hypothetical protein